ncbi:MAG: putative DNA-binding transcriptional regulator YafY [Parvicella sp.]|jgi:predicted DNA-binding transcriptional regulator YafY
MLKQIQRIERLHQLLRLKATGSPKECALKLDISERQLYNTLEQMKVLGAPIYFDSGARSYAYEYETACSFGFTTKNTRLDT